MSGSEIQPLDTLMYTKTDFRRMADQAIDSAILAVGTTSRPSRAIASSELLLKYLTVRGLHLTEIATDEAKALYRLGSFLGFNLLDDTEIVYFGMFDLEVAKEVVFRTKLLLQNLHQALEVFKNNSSKTMTQEQIQRIESLRSRIRIEVLVSEEINRDAVRKRVMELTESFHAFPWELLTFQDIQKRVDQEYEGIGEL